MRLEQIRRDWEVRYGLAAVAVAAALALRFALAAWVGPGLPAYITFYPAVMTVALLGGLGPGLLATALSGLTAGYWLLPPIGQFAGSSPIDRLGLLIFTGMGVFMSVVAELYRRDRSKALAYDKDAVLREMHQQNKFLAGIIESSSQPFAVGYPDGRLGLTNKAFDMLTGYSEDELRAIDWTEKLTPPEWREGERLKLEELNRTGEPVRYEKEYLRKDGTRVPIELLVHLVKGADGKPLHYFSFLTDITKRKSDEEALRASQELLKAVVDGSPNPIFMKDRQSRLLMANPATLRAMGRPAEEVIGKTDSEVYADPAIGRAIVEADQCIMASGVTEVVEETVQTPEGIRYFLSTKTPRRDAGKKVIGLIGVATDITERKQAETALKASRRAALNLTEDAVEARQQAEKARAELAQSEQRVRAKLESLLSPEGDIGDLELSDIIDGPTIQTMMEDFHKLARIPMAVIDLKGKVIVGVGWQDICTKFHRIEPGSCRNCIESDTQLSAGVALGEYKLYKCKNNMWDVATPLIVGGKHVGNVFSGQFFFADETPDRDLFRAQAKHYGFAEAEYLTALDRVPRLSRDQVNAAMGFFLKLAHNISQLSWSNIQIAREVTERKRNEEERMLTVDFLRLANESKDTRDFVRGMTAFFQKQSGCEAVGIRLKDGEDYPYFETRGFPQEFVEAENRLCARDGTDKVLMDGAGNPVMECMCGNVICGRSDPTKSFFTTGGSFWSNNTTRLLSSTTEADRQSRTRNRCNGEGYESVALIPLGIGVNKLGLLQLNDHHLGVFTKENIELWERLGQYAAEALAKFLAEEKVLRAKEEWERTFDSVPDLISIMDTEHRILRVNAAMARRLGRKPEDCVGLACYQCVHDLAAPPAGCPHSATLCDGQEHVAELRVDRFEGDFLVTTTPLQDAAGRQIGSVHVAHDISERKKKEREVLKLNRTLLAMGRSSQAMTRAKDEAAYMREVCDIITQDCGYVMVWIGLAEHDEAKTVRLAAQAGAGADYLDSVKLSWADDERGRGPTGTAIRTGKPSGCRDMRSDPAFAPWREEALRRGYASSLVLPLLRGGEAFGALTIYAKTADSFSDEETRLLASLADDLAAGIDTLRLRREKEQTEELLREAHGKAAWLARLPEESPTPLLRVAADGLVLYSNQAAAEAPGWVWKPDQPLGEPLRPLIERAFKEGGEIEETLQFGGRHYAISIVPILEGDYANVYSRDVTDRRQAEEALQRQADMLNLSHEAIFAWEFEGGILAWNQGAERLFGYTDQEALGCIKYELLRTQSSIGIDGIKSILLHGGAWTGELQQVTKDERNLTVEARLQLIKEPSGRLIVLETSHDITDRKRMEAELRRSHDTLELRVAQRTEELQRTLDRLRLITENISEVFWMADAGLERMLYVSPNYRRIWASVSDEIERKPRALLESIHPEDRARAADWLAGLRDGGARETHYRVVWPDGTIRHIRQNGLAVPGADGAAAGYVGVAQDVTERVRAEAEKERLSAQFQQAQKMQSLGQLAGGVAHDFNNMLAVISGYCGLILGDKPEAEELKGWVNEIRSAAEDATGLTKQLLAFSRKQVLEPEVFSPKEPIAKMAKMLRSALGEKIELGLRLAEDTGSIRIDPSQLEQAILNLSFNSRDAMPEGGKLIIETANLSVPQAYAGLTPGEYVQISVSDTGAGIPKDIQDKVFDPFFTTKPKGQGTGLGLAMVYGAVKQQEGEIFLHSEPGVGTTMRLCFKRVEEASAAAAAPVQAPTLLCGRGERVLLVEDETRVRKVMEETIRRGGYAVTAAASAEEAIAIFGQDGGFALVVSDVIMPGLNGAQLAARLRQQAPGLPFIFCSGYAGDLIAAGGEKIGDAPLLTKPVDPERLFRKMRELLAEARPAAAS